MGAIPTRYVVKSGDSLWKISGHHYGEGRFWPRIYVHNNRPEVLQVTKKTLVDPNLIHPGQTILLPEIPEALRKLYPSEVEAVRLVTSPNMAETLLPSASNIAQKVLMRPFPYKYKLDQEFGPIPGPGYKWKLKVSGIMAVAGKKSVPLIAISNRGLEVAAKKEYDLALTKAIQESKLEFDVTKMQLKYENMLTIRAGKSAQAVSLGTGLSSLGKPVLKARVILTGLKGTLSNIVYFSPEVKFDIEIEPDADPRRSDRSSASQVDQRRVGTPIGVALIATGIALAAATLVEDILTAGVGIVDDPATLAAAFAAIRSGAAAL